jgi:hypothetical protein
MFKKSCQKKDEKETLEKLYNPSSKHNMTIKFKIMDQNTIPAPQMG